MNKVRWGILSTSRFARNKVIPAFRKSQHAEVTAIASRSLVRAQAVARDYGIGRAHGSYIELLADPNVDAIYNPTPNHMHVEWSIKALEAGKHVLCEKPIGVSASEAQQLLDAARRHPSRKVMEAFMYRCHPQWQRAKQLVEAGKIGELRTIHSIFSYSNTDPTNIRNQVECAGGGMMDIGCYNISLSRFIFGEEPQRVFGMVNFDPQFGTDRLASGILDFGRGTATFTCSTQSALHQRVNIFGTNGRIEIEIPFNAPPDKPCRIWLQEANELAEIVFEPCDQYTVEVDSFSLAVLHDRPVPTPIEDAVANMRVIEAVFESSKKGCWVVA
jgi:predicted dehydrogenase